MAVYNDTPITSRPRKKPRLQEPAMTIYCKCFVLNCVRQLSGGNCPNCQSLAQAGLHALGDTADRNHCPACSCQCRAKFKLGEIDVRRAAQLAMPLQPTAAVGMVPGNARLMYETFGHALLSQPQHTEEQQQQIGNATICSDYVVCLLNNSSCVCCLTCK